MEGDKVNEDEGNNCYQSSSKTDFDHRNDQDDQSHIAGLMALQIDDSLNSPRRERYLNKSSTQHFEAKQFQFLSLPPELRYRVYEHIMKPTKRPKRPRVLKGHRTLRYNPFMKGNQSPRPLRNLMLTCRTLYAEIFHALPKLVDIPIHCVYDLTGYNPTPERNFDQEEVIFPLRYWLHPIMHGAPKVTSGWMLDEYTHKMLPNIPLSSLQDGNAYHRRRLEMVINLRVNKDASDPTTTVDLRLRRHLRIVKRSYRELQGFVHFKRKGPLCVCVLFRVTDKDIGGHMCNVLMEGGVATVTKRYKCALEDDVISGIFHGVFAPQVVE